MNLAIRADASQQIGTGHIMRMIALAQACRDQGGSAVFIVCECNDSLLERLAREGFTVAWTDEEIGTLEDAESVANFTQGNEIDWIVLDGYKFGPDYQTYLIEAGLRVVLLDDNAHHDRYEAHLVLNQNVFAGELTYRHPHDRTQLLLGVSYLLLRREFLNQKRTLIPEGQLPVRILIVLGGSDPLNLTGAIVELIGQFKERNLEIRVVMGPGSNHCPDDFTSRGGEHTVTVFKSPDNMAELYHWADSVITGAGSAVWECLFMGLHTGIVVVAENQNRMPEALKRFSSVYPLGDQREIKTELLLRFIDTPIFSDSVASNLLDGQGASRVLAQLKMYSGTNTNTDVSS